MLAKGCEAFVASLVESKSEPMDFSSIPIFVEFFDVFHEELLGLPPRRKVEFEIDSVLIQHRSQKLHTKCRQQNLMS